MPKPTTKLTAADLAEKADQLEAIQQQMLGLLDDADRLLSDTGVIYNRAEAYWLTHILNALSQENRYDTTLETTVKELRGTDEDEQDEDESED